LCGCPGPVPVVVHLVSVLFLGSSLSRLCPSILDLVFSPPPIFIHPSESHRLPVTIRPIRSILSSPVCLPPSWLIISLLLLTALSSFPSSLSRSPCVPVPLPLLSFPLLSWLSPLPLSSGFSPSVLSGSVLSGSVLSGSVLSGSVLSGSVLSLFHQILLFY